MSQCAMSLIGLWQPNVPFPHNVILKKNSYKAKNAKHPSVDSMRFELADLQPC
jgi:hypothetical protein